jgi:hypothetical protein
MFPLFCHHKSLYSHSDRSLSYLTRSDDCHVNIIEDMELNNTYIEWDTQ